MRLYNARFYLGGGSLVKQCASAPNNVIEQKGLLRVRHGEGQKERIVPLHPDVKATLRMFPMPTSGYLLTRPWPGSTYPRQ
jgi:hypothetical protein